MKLCDVVWCKSEARGKTSKYCYVHYNRSLLGLDMDAPIRRKDNKGWLNDRGYRVLRRPDHPNAWRNGDVLEHIVVMSEILGRPIDTKNGEMVHHKNGIRDDNDPKNLELCLHRQPPGQRVVDLVEWAKWLLNQYESECLIWEGE